MKSKMSICILSIFFIAMMVNTSFLGAQVQRPEQELINGQPQNNVSGVKNEWSHFTITIPQNAKNLEIKALGGTGDMDLYMKYNQRPGTDIYDCRPYKTGNDESCQVNDPQNGVYYISLYGYSEYSGLTLTANYDGEKPVEDKELFNKTPLTSQAGKKQKWTYYRVSVPQGASDLVIETNGGSGDADLYTQFGKRPGTKTYECRPYKSGNNEICNETKPKYGDYYIGLFGYSEYSNLTVTASYQNSGPDPKVIDIINNKAVKNIISEKDQWLFYRLSVPSNTEKLQFQMTGANGDGDLYIRLNMHPDIKSYDCRPYRMGSNEVCDFVNPSQGDYYIGIHAYEKFTNVKLKARFTNLKYGVQTMTVEDIIEGPIKD